MGMSLHMTTQAIFLIIAFEIIVNSIEIHYKTFYRIKPDRVFLDFKEKKINF